MSYSRVFHLVSSSCLALAIGLAAAGCMTTSAETTASIPEKPKLSAVSSNMTEADWRREVEAWKPRYDQDEGNAEAAINYARALRGIGQKGQAAAVLQQAVIRNPNEQVVLGAYGRALADTGQFTQAMEVLSKAHDPDKPDWRILSVQGTVLDQLGQPLEAQEYYKSALRLQPDDPTTMSNYGLSLALSKNLKEAEEVLRRAISLPGATAKVRQNLLLVLGLQGKFAEAEKIASAELPPQEVKANMAYLKGMMNQPNSWRMLQGGGASGETGQTSSRM